MENECMLRKRSGFPPVFFFLAVVFLSAPALLSAASVTNEGEATVKVSVRSAQGISGGGSIQPGKSLQLKSEILWIEHVPEGAASQVQLKIVENDGRTGFIRAPGGRYTFQKTPGSQPVGIREEKIEKPMSSTAGYAENRGNVPMSLSLIDSKNQQSYTLLLAGQKGVIPKEIVEVIVDRYGWSSGDVRITVFIVMPDGKEHTIRDAHAVVRIHSDPN